MRKEKLESYNLTGSIHTLQFKTDNEVLIPDGDIDYINGMSHYNNGTTSVTLNPNKGEGNLFDFGEFKRVFAKILSNLGVTEYKLLRVDFRLDSYSSEDYEKFQKLNKYLISLMAVTYSVKNKYRTIDLFTQKQLSIAIKCDSFELENYDRNAKNKVTGNQTEQAQARLEERTKSRQWRNLRNKETDELDNICYEFLSVWKQRWNKAIEHREQVHKIYNEHLVSLYLDGKNAFPVQFRTLTDFLIQYQNCIFSRAQMIDLLIQLKRADPSLDFNNPEKKADNFKRRYGIEYFSLHDLKTAISEIENATNFYFTTLTE